MSTGTRSFALIPYGFERWCAAVSVVLMLVALPATAQQEGASIIGQVTDESGAVLPGVTVTASSPSLQLQSVTVVTDQLGQYRLAPLPIGLYEVSYTLAG